MPIAEWRFVVSLQCREAGRWGTRIHIKKESFQATLSRPEMTARNIIPLPRSRHRRKREAMDLPQSVSVHPGGENTGDNLQETHGQSPPSHYT